MIRLSTKSRYGTRLMLSLALHQNDHTTVLKKIADEQDIPIRYLEQIVIPLKNSGLVRSVRGAGGGFVLTRPPKDILMSEIVRTLEGSCCLVECVDDENYCPRREHCASYELWQRVSQNIESIFKKTTLQDLVKLHEQKNH